MMSPFSRFSLVRVRPGLPGVSAWHYHCAPWAVAGLLVLTLSGCGSWPWVTQESQRPVVRRRALADSQRREARMARPGPRSDRPVVDYVPYKRINLGMAIAEVQTLLEATGQRYDVGVMDGMDAMDVQAESLAENDGSAGLFWLWTHPSGVYNIHVRLESAPEPNEWVVKAKWLTYNPPE